MTLANFIKKLLLLDVIWGRRSKMLHGIRDGGAMATAIGNTAIAQEHNGNSIFNVNNPANESMGGHYHNVTLDPTEVCLSFEIADWVNNQITIIAAGVPGPGQIGPHLQTTTCLMVQIYKKINVPSINSFTAVDLQIMIDSATKNILLIKSAKPADFAGKVLIDAK